MWKVILKNTHTAIYITIDGVMARDRAEVEVAVQALVFDPTAWTVLLAELIKPSPRNTDERRETRRAHTQD